VNPNRSVQIDSASSAAGSTKCFTSKYAKSRSMQAKSAWKYPCSVHRRKERSMLEYVRSCLNNDKQLCNKESPNSAFKLNPTTKTCSEDLKHPVSPKPSFKGYSTPTAVRPFLLSLIHRGALEQLCIEGLQQYMIYGAGLFQTPYAQNIHSLCSN
jgi:hypothetical protein